LRLLRRVFDRDLFASRATDLALDADAPLESDVQRFLTACTAGRHDVAVAEYRADLLDGIYLDRAPRFEEFIEQERARLRALFTDSCAFEARRLAQSGQHAAAAALARRWLQAQPLSVDAAEAWLRALLAPGTVEAVHTAREQFAAYSARLAAEYDARPESRLAKLLQDAADALAVHQQSAAARVAELTGGAARPRATHGGATVDSTPAPVASSVAAADPSSRVTPSRGRRALLMTLGVVGALVAVWQIGARVSEAPLDLDGTGRPPLVVLADAEAVVGDSMLSDAITLAMGTALTESNAVRLVSAARVWTLRALTTSPTDSAAARGPLTETLVRTIAMRAGAAAVAVPVVVAIGEQYRVALRIVQTRDGSALLSIQSEAVPARELLAALDDVVRRAGRRLGGTRVLDEPDRALPEYTTASLEALRALAQGTRDFNRNEYAGAIAAYQQAVRLDSTFALGWTALGRVLALANRPQDADSAFTVALRHAARLTPRERVLVTAAALRVRGLGDSAIVVRAAWLHTHPDDLELLRSQVFDLLTRGRRVEAVTLAEQYLQRDSTDEAVWINLALAYDGEDLATRRQALRAFSRALVLDSTQRRSLMLPQQYGGLLVRAQLYDSAARFFRTIGGTDVRMRGRAMRALGQMELLRSRPDSAVPAFVAAIEDGRTLADTLTWVRSRLWLATTLLTVGDSGRARWQLDTLGREATWLREPQVQYWIGLQLARVGRVADASAVLRALERVALPTSRVHTADRTLLAAEIATARGRARQVLPSLGEAVLLDSSAISLETLAWVTLQAGDTADARDRARVIFERQPGFGFEGWLARDRATLWLNALSGTRPRERAFPERP
jgi:DNA-binding SARP family transcriptional activator/Flp pilus assembly protein TadD